MKQTQDNISQVASDIVSAKERYGFFADLKQFTDDFGEFLDVKVRNLFIFVAYILTRFIVSVP